MKPRTQRTMNHAIVVMAASATLMSVNHVRGQDPGQYGRFYLPLTLAPAPAEGDNAGGGGATDEAKADAAEPCLSGYLTMTVAGRSERRALLGLAILPSNARRSCA